MHTWSSTCPVERTATTCGTPARTKAFAAGCEWQAHTKTNWSNGATAAASPGAGLPATQVEASSGGVIWCVEPSPSSNARHDSSPWPE
eukprot:scaffold11024_cov90-Isochrysis_galbana.AAC.2